MANESNAGKSANIWPWALVTGLAVGFLVGREMGGRPGSAAKSDDEAKPVAAAAAPANLPTKIYKSEAEFPANWTKSAALTGITSFDGLTEAQKATALQALNERKCECGCGHESVAFCLAKDPNCPRGATVKEAVAMAKRGETLANILAYVDRENAPKPAQPQPAAAAPAGAKKVPVPAHAPRIGPKHAKVTVVAFSDFQCPFCKRAVPTMKEIEKTYPKDVAIVFMHQPLSFHDKAMGAAQAMMAAGRQGKAWQMHDKMFENNTALDVPDLERYAKEIGLNVDKFKKDFNDPKIKEQIQADITLANSVGATGTPTFFINGREQVGALPFASFKPIIDEEIKKADDLIKKGTPIAQVYDKLMEQAAAAPPPAPAAAAPAPDTKVDIAVGDSPAKGPASAPVQIVAFSDFECPFCSRVLPTFKQIEDTYKGKVRIAFKHLPLSFHPNAQIAAEASMAAHEQGKFWEYHDKLFQNQRALDRASLEKYAQELNLNMAKFKQALDSGKYREKVQKDAAEAGRVGASGTPTQFVNGRMIVGAESFDKFKAIIDDELAKKKG